MKEKEIKKLEKLKEQEELPEKEKQELKKITFNNFINSISVMSLLIILMLIAFFVNKQVVILIYKISSIIILLFSIFLFEKAYKKDDGTTAISGIEMLVLSIIILFSPYRILKD